MDWPQVTKYKCLVSSQGHRVEIINVLYTEVIDPQKGTVRGGMIRLVETNYYFVFFFFIGVLTFMYCRDLVVSFHKSTGYKPSRIIFYRFVEIIS